MMRRSVSTAVVLVIALAACSDDDAPSSTQDGATPTTGTVVDSTAAPDNTGVATTTAAPSTSTATSTATSTTIADTSPDTAPPTTGEAVPGTTATETADPGPYAPGAEWEVDSPDAHGIDVAGLDKARDYAFAAGKNTQGVVVVHHGAIVGEWYEPRTGRKGSWAASWSMAKSFTSALIGIALEEGLIPSSTNRWRRTTRVGGHRRDDLAP